MTSHLHTNPFCQTTPHFQCFLFFLSLHRTLSPSQTSTAEHILSQNHVTASYTISIRFNHCRFVCPLLTDYVCYRFKCGHSYPSPLAPPPFATAHSSCTILRTAQYTRCPLFGESVLFTLISRYNLVSFLMVFKR